MCPLDVPPRHLSQPARPSPRGHCLVSSVSGSFTSHCTGQVIRKNRFFIVTSEAENSLSCETPWWCPWGSQCAPVTDSLLSQAHRASDSWSLHLSVAGHLHSLTGTMVVGPLVGLMVGPLVHPLASPLVGPLFGLMVGPLVHPLASPLVGPLFGLMVGSLVHPLASPLVGPLFGLMVGPLVHPLASPLVGPVVGLMVGILAGSLNHWLTNWLAQLPAHSLNYCLAH